MVSLSRVVAVGAVVGAAVLAAPAPAFGDEDVSYQVETSVASSYISRGIPQYNDRSSPSSQNTAAVQVNHVLGGAVTFGVWSAVAMNDFDEQPGTAVEIDLSVAYSYHTGAVTLSGGYAANLFPKHDDASPVDGAHEISGQVSYDNAYVVPSAAAYVEVARQQGVYLTVGASRDLHAGAWTFSPMVSVGGATYRRYGGADRAAAPHLNDVTASVAARRDFDGGLYALARLSYSLCGTPAELLPMDPGWGFDGRSSVYGAIAFGVAR
jgi:hypothetical protein